MQLLICLASNPRAAFQLLPGVPLTWKELRVLSGGEDEEVGRGFLIEYIPAMSSERSATVNISCGGISVMFRIGLINRDGARIIIGKTCYRFVVAE